MLFKAFDKVRHAVVSYLVCYIGYRIAGACKQRGGVSHFYLDEVFVKASARDLFELTAKVLGAVACDPCEIIKIFLHDRGLLHFVH